MPHDANGLLLSLIHIFIEPSLGCDRVALAFLCEAYDLSLIHI